MCMFYSKHVRVLMKSKSFLNQSLCHSRMVRYWLLKMLKIILYTKHLYNPLLYEGLSIFL